METFWLFRLWFRRAYDSAYDSDFQFLPGHKPYYDSDYDSDSDSDSHSVASENQPLALQCSTNWAMKTDMLGADQFIELIFTRDRKFTIA